MGNLLNQPEYDKSFESLIATREQAEKIIMERIQATTEDYQKLKESQYRFIFARFLLYFAAMPIDLKNEVVTTLLDSHVPSSLQDGGVFDATA